MPAESAERCAADVKLGIMQPYFFPYIGYYDLINRCDTWVVFDLAQYRAKSWMNRNRMQHPKSGWQYITVPVRAHTRSTSIAQIEIADPQRSKERILAQIAHYRTRRAPYFDETHALVERCFDSCATGRLCELNVASLRVVCDYLDIPFAPVVLSTSGLQLPVIERPGSWALEIATLLGADEYLNPAGGAHLFDGAEFKRRGIVLTFLQAPPLQYAGRAEPETEALSILDTLMWNGRADVKAYLQMCRGAAR